MKECTFTAGFSFFKPSVMGMGDGLTVFNLISDMLGDTYQKGVMTVTATKAAVPPGGVTSLGMAIFLVDAGLVPNAPALTITAVVSAGGLIEITTATNHGMQTGDLVLVAGVQGTVEANGTGMVIVVSPTQFKLAQSTFVNAYTSGGTATLLPSVFIANSATNPFFLQIQPGKACFCTPTVDLVGNPLYAWTSLAPLLMTCLLVSF
jgi:hypothetical protein